MEKTWCEMYKDDGKRQTRKENIESIKQLTNTAEFK